MCSQKNSLSGEGRGREAKIVASLPPTESWQIFFSEEHSQAARGVSARWKKSRITFSAAVCAHSLLCVPRVPFTCFKSLRRLAGGNTRSKKYQENWDTKPLFIRVFSSSEEITTLLISVCEVWDRKCRCSARIAVYPRIGTQSGERGAVAGAGRDVSPDMHGSQELRTWCLFQLWSSCCGQATRSPHGSLPLFSGTGIDTGGCSETNSISTQELFQ